MNEALYEKLDGILEIDGVLEIVEGELLHTNEDHPDFLPLSLICNAIRNAINDHSQDMAGDILEYMDEYYYDEKISLYNSHRAEELFLEFLSNYQEGE